MCFSSEICISLKSLSQCLVLARIPCFPFGRETKTRTLLIALLFSLKVCSFLQIVDSFLTSELIFCTLLIHL